MNARHSDFCPICGKRASSSPALNDCLCAPGHAERLASTGPHPARQPYPIPEAPKVLPLDGWIRANLPNISAPIPEDPKVLPLDGFGGRPFSGQKTHDGQAMSPDAILIAEECDALKAMLLEKNRAYGSSALSPIRIFSKADTVEQIKVRLDDKLSRLVRGSASGEDVVLDLLGYLILLRIATRGTP